jgi:hypothetical protein
MQTAFLLLLSVFSIVALGAALGGTRAFGDATVNALSTFVWHVAVPAFMFRTMATNELPGLDELEFIALYYGAALTVYVALGVATGLLFKLQPGERPAIALAGCFANGMMLGVPIVGGAFGDDALHLLFMLIAFHQPVFVTASTVWLEIERGHKEAVGATLARSAASLLRQTPLIALVLGLATAASGLVLPEFLDRTLAMLAATMVPVGLFAVGASLRRVDIHGDLPQASLAMLTKLLIMPAATFAVTRIAGAPPSWIAVATVMAGLPTGVLAFNFATANGVAPRRVATVFLLANVVSLATLTLWIGWLLRLQ